MSKRIDLTSEYQYRELQSRTRRHFIKQCTTGLGGIALGSLLGCGRSNPTNTQADIEAFVRKQVPHFAPSAKRIIYLHMAGAPSQLELFDYKPELAKLDGKDCPQSLLEGKKFAFIQGVPKMLGPQAEFSPRGNSGMMVSDNLPHFSTIVDDVTLINTMHTDQFNHAPAQLLLQTGSPRLGRPSMGSWVTYGLGSENEDLPGFMVLVSGGNTPDAGKSVWGSGFLPSVYQGVQCRSEGDPVLYVSNPSGIDGGLRKKTIDAINQINEKEYKEFGDPETLTRISQYEMAYRMQTSVPDVMDINDEPEYIHEMYGTEPGKTSFANNCLLARRLVEKGVRFVQLFDWGWDMHGVAEREALAGLADVTSGVTGEKGAGVTSDVKGGVTLEVTGGVTPDVTQNRLLNRQDNDIKGDVRRMTSLFTRAADKLGQPRVLNTRDFEVMEGWLRQGLIQPQWEMILSSHVAYCKDERREIARSLGYFVEPVKKMLSKSASPKVQGMVKDLAKSMRLK